MSLFEKAIVYERQLAVILSLSFSLIGVLVVAQESASGCYFAMHGWVILAVAC